MNKLKYYHVLSGINLKDMKEKCFHANFYKEEVFKTKKIYQAENEQLYAKKKVISDLREKEEEKISDSLFKIMREKYN